MKPAGNEKTMVIKLPETGDSTKQTQTREVTIPNIKNIVSVKSSTGKATTSLSGSTVTVTATNGTRVRGTTEYPLRQVGPATISWVDIFYGTETEKPTFPLERFHTLTSYDTNKIYNNLGWKEITETTTTGTLLPDKSYFHFNEVTKKWNGYGYYYGGGIYGKATVRETTDYYAYEVTITYVDNTKPTISVTTQNNQSLTESKTFTLQGTTIDIDNGNVVTVKYQINNGTTRALQSGVSNGSTPLSFSKVLTYRGGRLYDGTLDVSGLLAEGIKHTLSLWAEDDQGGKSDVVTRTFTVKHNKAPIITVDTFPAVQSGLIPPDSITLSGTSSDPDGNTLTVKAKLNSGTEQTLLNGVTSGNWSYTCKVSDLKAGANTVTITATDQFGAYTVKTFNINNAVTETPLKKAVARYKILAPKGSTREILAWLKREKGNLVVDAEASFVDKGQPEQYTAMTKESVDLTTSISEDELLGAVTTAKSDAMFKLTLSRTNTSTNESAVMLVGVIS
ncbi:hypothetical protein O0555_05375 [Brevibacillus laterosporus]|uniref:Ig-like domain-containing protein n=1 Tax=Brevibacillus laterosporus TaxID=1465 RepID=UPI000CE4BAB3|nr:hypothetical protein [Brevibacillus laterosporus]MBG9798249.1 hypothetical protein [Brevibacillus laterosporus]MCR8936780.1 hypothetical protein [Brevibacillus laterosporus]MCZ0839419.1 hypothetical protein [Brevibacillus laterosporus]MCZ0845463.1 hypothetical protein [Brevibacillus laterosporus]MED1912089.1 hypothetical protein [Brevibacillus laterosporus]